MSNWRSKRITRHRRARPRALRVEVLRERIVLDGSGLGVSDPLPWFDPGALTYSFAPDGTSVAGEESRLFEQLAPLGEVAQWQAEFDSAFNAWLAPLGASIQETQDSGSRFGVAGRTQGDARFGDIRIAAVPLSQSVLATSVPHSAMVQGSWAGDILINANAQWNNLQEVFAVAMHEFGHVLGLGHSADPQSPMFKHGVHDAVAPIAGDVETLRDLYVGIRFEDKDDAEGGGHAETGEPETETHDENPDAPVFTFDPNSAVPLTPAIGSTLRYSALGALANSTATVIYRLDPTLNEPEGLENLTLALQSTGTSRLIADLNVFDEQGRKVESQVLHNGQGSLIVQAQEVESNEVHYVVVSSSTAAPEASRDGGFEIVMDFVPELRSSRKVGEIQLDQETPVVDQSFSVSSSRLVHIHLDSQGEIDLQTAIFVQLIDETDNVLTQLVMRPGTSRSAPLSFLPAGNYTLRFMTGSESDVVPESHLSVYLDEVSIDVGPGIYDPTDTPYLACDEPGANSDSCYVYVPITPDPPTVPDPAPEPIGSDYPWWWEYAFACSDYGPDEFEFVQADDPLWWDFYVEGCQAVTPPPTNPPPTNPPPTNPPPTNPPPSGPRSPWQNHQDNKDVSGNQFVTALDALIVINMLGRSSGVKISVTDAVPDVFADVNGDFIVSALDALMVINSLARDRVGAESEFVFSAIPPRSISFLTDETQAVARDFATGRLF